MSLEENKVFTTPFVPRTTAARRCETADKHRSILFLDKALCELHKYPLHLRSSVVNFGL